MLIGGSISEGHLTGLAGGQILEVCFRIKGETAITIGGSSSFARLCGNRIDQTVGVVVAVHIISQDAR
ncbi:hypothetical protein V6x_40020 [Gimesia chilikensis]|uniref:Uncharacterized protein n=1 Tax=Gimesia chilikensis TaxID=2605989 RepID=A0A517WG80_9PLAN|nr:hypothetical protein V6x_40020 [Gimesia chilikensis]